jgi:hypothetical protein
MSAVRGIAHAVYVYIISTKWRDHLDYGMLYVNVLQCTHTLDYTMYKQASLHFGAVNTQYRCYTFGTPATLCAYTPHVLALLCELVLGQNKPSSISVSKWFLSLASTCDGAR